MSTSTSELIGASVRRIDALEKVLGTTRYGQDFWMDGSSMAVYCAALILPLASSLFVLMLPGGFPAFMQ